MSIWFRVSTALSERLRTLTFGFLTPFYFIRAGSFVSIPALVIAPAAFLFFLAVKIGSKIVGVYPVAKLFAALDREAMYTTLLMSTGLTFGTISALFGLSHGIINQAQYSSLVATVIASAVIPTVIANAFYLPRHLLPSSRLENANRTVRRPYRLGRIGPSRIARGGARKSTLEKPMIRITVQCRVDAVSRLRQGSSMITTKLDLKGLKCPLPALKTRKALKALNPGDRLEVHCTDPLSVIDIPNLIRETGDKVEITGQAEQVFVFLIEKQNGFVGTADE